MIQWGATAAIIGKPRWEVAQSSWLQLCEDAWRENSTGLPQLAGWSISWKILWTWMMTWGTPMTKRKPPGNSLFCYTCDVTMTIMTICTYASHVYTVTCTALHSYFSILYAYTFPFRHDTITFFPPTRTEWTTSQIDEVLQWMQQGCWKL